MTRAPRVVTMVGVWVLACAPFAAAQDGSIEQLVAMALERSPDIRAARSAIGAAGGQVTQASLRPNPALSGSQSQMAGTQHRTILSVDWPLDLFRRPARVAAAERLVDATRLSVEDQERALAASVRTGAGRLLAARRLVEVTADALTAARRMRDLLAQRVSEGGIPQLDANVALVEVGRMEADLILAQADADATAIELKALAGLAADTPLVLRDSLESLVRVDAGRDAPVTAGAATTGTAAAGTSVVAGAGGAGAGVAGPGAAGGDAADQVVAARADVREAAARVALADARIDQARQEGRADVMLSGGYGHEWYGFEQRGFNAAGNLEPVVGSFHSVIVGARLVLPVRDRNQGAVAVAEAERSGEEDRLAGRRLAARAELDAAMTRDREARRAVELYATTIRDLARQNVDVQLQAYDLGGATLADLLTEQRRYLDVEGAYTRVLAGAYDARVALRRARGEVR